MRIAWPANVNAVTTANASIAVSHESMGSPASMRVMMFLIARPAPISPPAIPIPAPIGPAMNRLATSAAVARSDSRCSMRSPKPGWARICAGTLICSPSSSLSWSSLLELGLVIGALVLVGRELDDLLERFDRRQLGVIDLGRTLVDRGHPHGDVGDAWRAVRRFQSVPMHPLGVALGDLLPRGAADQERPLARELDALVVQRCREPCEQCLDRRADDLDDVAHGDQPHPGDVHAGDEHRDARQVFLRVLPGVGPITGDVAEPA